MTRYFLGVDVGATKTHALVADEHGQAVGFGQGGPGNHETVGYEGLQSAMQEAAAQALARARISRDQIAGAGFGVAGLDWPSEEAPTRRAIHTLGLTAPVEAVNDTLIGLLAGSAEGWGIAIVSGTGCNCWGWDRHRQRQGRSTGGSLPMGEAAGASELVARAVQAVAHEWTRRGPPTQLTPALVRHVGAHDAADLLQGLMEGRIDLDAAAAPLVFQTADRGDPVANDLIRWAGRELGHLAIGVIHQLEFETLDFDAVLVGGMFNGVPSLVEPLQTTIHAVAPGARLVRLDAPPVVGAVLLGMEQADVDTTGLRELLTASTRPLLEEP